MATRTSLLINIPAVATILAAIFGGDASTATATIPPSAVTDLPAASPSIVEVAQGRLKGIVASNYRAFLGVPYARPPVDDLRWRAPQTPPDPWNGVRDATEFASPCPQLATDLGNTGSLNEDCLYLNVYAPLFAPTSLPVMVWIHGGGFSFGAGSDYDGSMLAANGGVIVVTLNYRLGAFGFLALDGLSQSDPYDSSGNYGLEDQQAALQWVQDNIVAFGGDPGNVTIFGESAGSISSCLQIVSPLAAGLFGKAIVQSGPCSARYSLVTQSQAESTGAGFAARPTLGCDNANPLAVVSCMRSKSAGQIMDALSTDEASGLHKLFEPVIDGHVIPMAPSKAIQIGRFNRVPVLEGTTHDEGRLFIAAAYDFPDPPITLNADNYVQSIEQQLSGDSYMAGLLAPALAPVLASQYPLLDFPAPDGYDAYTVPAHLALSAITTDAGFSCMADSSAGMFDAAGSLVYAYEFSDPEPPALHDDPYMPLGAAHASELVYVFQAPMLNGRGVSPSMFTPEQYALSTQMQEYWTSFAKTGNPNSKGLPHWPRYTGAYPSMLTLAPGDGGTRAITSHSFVVDHRCDFWHSLGI